MNPEDLPKHEGKATRDGARPFQVGGADVDPQTLTVTVGGVSHHLTDLTWRFLRALIEKAPDTATPDFLAQTVWQQTHVSDETIAQRVRQLRRIFSDDPKAPQYIRTVRGKGYQCIAEIKTVHAHQRPEVSASVQKWKKSGLRVILGAVLAAAAIAALIIFQALQTRSQTSRPLTAVQELVLRADEYRARAQPEANETAIGLYEKALAAEANNQRALVGMSYALSHETSKFGKSAKHADKAAAFADRAILNDPSSAGAFAARGLADDVRGRVSSAINYYQRSLEIDASDQSTRTSIAYLYQAQGRFHAALHLEKQALDNAPPTYFSDLQIAIALDGAELNAASQRWFDRAVLMRPDAIFLADYRARRMMKAGQYSGALAVLSALNPPLERHHVLKATAYLLNGNNAAVRISTDMAERNAEDNGRTCYICFALRDVQGRAFDEAKARAFTQSAQDAIDAGVEWPEYRVELAYTYLALGQDDEAVAAIEAAYDLGYRDWRWLEISPLLTKLKARTDFKNLLIQMQQAAKEERVKIQSDAMLKGFLEQP